MKPFFFYLKHAYPVLPITPKKYYAYKNGETKIFDNIEDALKFSHLYDVVYSEDAETQQQEILRHNAEQGRLAKDQFDMDLQQESGFNAYQISICKDFIKHYIHGYEYEVDRDDFAEYVLAISELLSNLNHAKD